MTAMLQVVFMAIGLAVLTLVIAFLFRKWQRAILWAVALLLFVGTSILLGVGVLKIYENDMVNHAVLLGITLSYACFFIFIYGAEKLHKALRQNCSTSETSIAQPVQVVDEGLVQPYNEGIMWLKEQGFTIYGAIIDGLRGLSKILSPIPVQMCQFHQLQIVKRYLASEPEIEASRELLNIAKMLTKTDKESFIGMFSEWHDKYKDIINERVRDKRIKRKTPPYMRTKLRSAYLSLKRNMPLLWTYYDRPETGLTNTNNSLEGIFCDIKTKLRIHSGVSREFRKKIIDGYIKRHY